MGGILKAMRKAAHHLEQRRQGFYAVLDVPAELRQAVGERRLRRSLRTQTLLPPYGYEMQPWPTSRRSLHRRRSRPRQPGLADRLEAKLADMAQVIRTAQAQPMPEVMPLVPALSALSAPSVVVTNSDPPRPPPPRSGRQRSATWLRTSRSGRTRSMCSSGKHPRDVRLSDHR